MTRQVELRLIPAPGAKAEFLATLEPNTSTPPWWENAPKEVILEGYTRDSWALDTSTQWYSVQVKSVDGRNKLPGFVKYLRERKKTAYGRFGRFQVWVVSHKQASSSTLACRVAPMVKIPNCPLKSKQAVATKPRVPNPAPATASAPKVNNAPALAGTKKKKGFGLLGGLVGAQKRTNQQVKTATVSKQAPAAASGSGGDSTSATDASSAAATTPDVPQEDLKTAGQVLSEFRQEMEQEMLDFDIAHDTVLKVKIDLASKLRTMTVEEKQSGRVTMEILKYIVYEQAEEVNEEWIAHREPSEFMDEAVIAIYKEGEAPPEVLEDINKGELPDEVRGQQRALQDQQQKAAAQRAMKEDAVKQKAALRQNDDDDFATLNTNKRDRRTIEDFEREKRQRIE